MSTDDNYGATLKDLRDAIADLKNHIEEINRKHDKECTSLVASLQKEIAKSKEVENDLSNKTSIMREEIKKLEKGHSKLVEVLDYAVNVDIKELRAMVEKVGLK